MSLKPIEMVEDKFVSSHSFLRKGSTLPIYVDLLEYYTMFSHSAYIHVYY